MKNTIKLTVNILIFAFLTFSITKYVYKTNYFKIKNINIKGNNFIEEKTIYQIIESETNTNLLNLNLKKIQSELNKNDYIYSSKVFTLFPSYVFIEINEIIPIGIYENNNKRYLLDINSNSIQANNKSLNYYNVPIITNLNKYTDKRKISYLLKNILTNNETLYLLINEINLNDDKININLISNTKITLNKNNSEYDLRVLLKFIDSISDVKNLSSYKYIDLSVKNQIIVKEIS